MRAPPVSPGTVDSEEEPPDDRARVEEAARGGRRAFQRLYARYYAPVRAVALANLGWPEADDVTQEVFLRAWERLPQLRHPERFGPWLLQIARNRCVDHHRRARVVGAPAERGALPPPVSEAMEVLRAIQRLPSAYRETLVMRLVEGMSGPEIASRTGLTPRSVRVNLHRGMLKLRAALGEELP
ncbi:MAG: sigma-70 family RNA polymerase sigma factor [Myxococcales bacterium]|nr:sigma-70 family RNA polymerase sigma factor [Myxococcales bacterium]MCB9755861.1 sigma-70 family RNA polymerase sigma factor [Myxococcales bacterium]